MQDKKSQHVAEAGLWKGLHPAILDSEKYGAAARDLFRDGQELLREIIRDRSP